MPEILGEKCKYVHFENETNELLNYFYIKAFKFSKQLSFQAKLSRRLKLTEKVKNEVLRDK